MPRFAVSSHGVSASGLVQHYFTAALVVGLLAITPLHATAAEAKTVALTIDYADGSQRVYTGLAVEEGQTVLDLLEAAAKHPRGVAYKHRGSGIAVMVTEIDGLKNEGATGKNWLYKVNDKWADRSCGVFKLQPGDTVLWTFGKEK